MCGWRNQSCPRRRSLWRALYPVYDVDLFHRRRGGKYHATLLVSALYNERHGICVKPDPTGKRRKMFGLGHHLGSANFGTTAQRFEKWPVGPTQANIEKYYQPVHQMGMGFGNAWNQAAVLWQHRWPCVGCQRHVKPVRLDRDQF